jgi:hypothetical protein
MSLPEVVAYLRLDALESIISRRGFEEHLIDIYDDLSLNTRLLRRV